MTKDEKHTNLTPEIKQACMMLGIAVMSDIRMVVREELERASLANTAARAVLATGYPVVFAGAGLNPNDVVMCGCCGEHRWSPACNSRQCKELEAMEGE